MNKILSFLFAYWICATVEGLSIPISVVDSEDGSSKFVQFQHSTDSKLEIIEAIKEFCSSLKNMDPNYCEAALYTEYVKLSEKDMKVPEWLREKVVQNNFSEDLLLVACNEMNLVYYDNLNDCRERAGKAIRSVKMYLASYHMKETIDHIDKNQIIPVPSDWKLSVEGHTFMFEGKIRLMQELADDPRVENICEIGLNLGHSVS